MSVYIKSTVKWQRDPQTFLVASTRFGGLADVKHSHRSWHVVKLLFLASNPELLLTACRLQITNIVHYRPEHVEEQCIVLSRLRSKRVLCLVLVTAEMLHGKSDRALFRLFSRQKPFKARASYVEEVLVGFVQDVYVVHGDPRHAIIPELVGSDHTVVWKRQDPC